MRSWWLRDRRNKQEAVDILRARLDLDPQAAAEAFDQFAGRPWPEIRTSGLRQVIDVVWEADKLPLPKGEPEAYMDLTYLRRAGGVPSQA